MGAQGITGVIVLYINFAPHLYYSLEPLNSDGIGGIKKLGDSLWIFALITVAVSLLTTICLFGISWEGLGTQWVQTLFLSWVSLPYIVAIMLVVIPGLAVRRQVNLFKKYRMEGAAKRESGILQVLQKILR